MEKKKYVKPAMTVIEVDPQQIICSSPDLEYQYNPNDDSLDELGNGGEFW